MEHQDLEERLAEQEEPLLGGASTPVGSIVVEGDESSNDTLEEEEESFPPHVPPYYGPLLLLLVAFLYSTFNVSLRKLYEMPKPPTPSAVSAARGWMSAIFFLPFYLMKPKSSDQTLFMDELSTESSQRLPLWIAAGELAFWNFCSQALFTLGLLTTPSARASFLGQTTVVMVPIICAFSGEKLRYLDGIGCLSSVVGLILLSHEDPATTSTPSSNNSFGVGDICILVGAFTWSFYVVRISKFAHAYDEVHLQGVKNLYLAFMYTGWFGVAAFQSDSSLWAGWHNWVAWLVLAYSAFGPGTLADLIQQKAQASVGATESNLILCTESVFTAILGRLVLGEETSWIEKVGGAFLIAGAVVSGM